MRRLYADYGTSLDPVRYRVFRDPHTGHFRSTYCTLPDDMARLLA